LTLLFFYMLPRTDSLWSLLFPNAAFSASLGGVWAIASIDATGREFAAERLLLRKIAAGFVAGSALSFYSLALVIGTGYAMVKWSRAYKRSDPNIDAFIITQKLAEWTSGSKLSFDNLRDRRDNLRHLEWLALIFDGGLGLPRYYGSNSGDEPPFKLVAAHFRNLRSWIVLPQADTRRNLQVQFAATLNALASGEYHYLPRAEHASVVIRTSVGRRLLNGGRVLLVGALPFIALLMLQATTANVDERVQTTWLIGSIAWACVTLISVMDPLLAEKATTTRDLLGIFTHRKQD
jgi:hypothetical protein